jgi:hypothetical protein
LPSLPHFLSSFLQAYVKWLFGSSKLAEEPISAQLAAHRVAQRLCEDAASSLAVLDTQVYAQIPGSDYGRLQPLFALAAELEAKAGAAKRPSFAALSTVLAACRSAALAGVDFKDMMSGRAPLDVVAPCLTPAMAEKLATVSEHVPWSADPNGRLTPSKVKRKKKSRSGAWVRVVWF